MRSVIYAVLALCLGFAASTALPASASAAQQSLPALSLQDFAKGSGAETVSYKHYCVRQYFRCRNYTESGWEFRRCMKHRGCWDAYRDYRENRARYSCRNWRNACAENWGYGNNDYYGCLRYHGCE